VGKTILQLRNIWNKEKESYKTQEVGSGTQRFVKDVLECTYLFDLKERRFGLCSILQQTLEGGRIRQVRRDTESLLKEQALSAFMISFRGMC